MTEAKEPLNWLQAELPGRLREIVVVMADRLTDQTVRRVRDGLDRDDPLSAVEALVADINTRRPTVTRAELDMLDLAVIAYQPRQLDEQRNPQLLRARKTLGALPVISHGDDGAPPLTSFEAADMFEAMVDTLYDRLDPGRAAEIRYCIDVNEAGIALEFLMASLDQDKPAVTHEERAALRRLLLFYEQPPENTLLGLFDRAEAIVAALPALER